MLMSILLTSVLATTGAPTPQRAPADSIIVSAEWLASHLNDPRVVVVDVEHDSASYASGHIPGARLLSYMAINGEKDGNHTELLPATTLRELFESLGVSSGSHVVLYSSLAPMASRAFFTLDYLGNVQVSILNGGLADWQRAGKPVSHDVPRVARGNYTPAPRADVVVDGAWVKAQLGTHGVSFIDTRSDGEYVGSGERHGMPSAGHLAGAHQLQWEQLFADSKTGAFLPREQLARLYAARVTPGDTVVTYCYVGYRASMTYLVARMLGYPTKLYDGSYEDWSRRNYPLVTGARTAIAPGAGEGRRSLFSCAKDADQDSQSNLARLTLPCTHP